MFKEPFDIIELISHADPRGVLYEVLRFKDNAVPGEGQLYCYTVNPNHRRGDHYHEKKQEWFACVSGKLIALIEDASGNKKKIALTGERPAIIYCGPRTAHALLNESASPAVVVAYSSAQHDPENPDTISKFIEI